MVLIRQLTPEWDASRKTHRAVHIGPATLLGVAARRSHEQRLSKRQLRTLMQGAQDRRRSEKEDHNISCN